MIMRTVILFVLVVGVFIYGFFAWLNIPYVHKSYSTKECLFIEYADGTLHNCDVMPRRYEIKWHR